MMKTFSCFFILVASFFCVSLRSEEPKPKLNVLFIVADDLNTQLGCYGNNVVQSPNIDRLASQGIRFDKAYCQFPVCGPSRNSFLTGLYPDTTRVRSNGGKFRKSHPNAITLPQLFKENGYQTVRVGKIFHQGVPDGIGSDGVDDSASWNKVFNPSGRDKTDESKVKNYTPDFHLGSAISILEAGGTGEEQTDGKVATEAIKQLEENQKQPFFLAVGFYRPHVPLIAPKKYFDLHPLEKISLPKEPQGERDTKPKAAFFSEKILDGMNEEDSRRAIQAYYASTSLVDDQMGRILDALDRLKLRENTVIVFLGDHGFHLGEHGSWHKLSLYNESARVPLLISAPNLKERGKSCPRTVELVSLYPTLAEICSLSSPSNLDGKSFRALMDNPNAPWDQAAFTQTKINGSGRSIRTEKWFYALWNDNAAELYDTENDPHEYNNLINDPKYKEKADELKKILENHTKAILDKAPPLTDAEKKKKEPAADNKD
jgi:iduronate 2-sulfatase